MKIFDSQAADGSSLEFRNTVGSTGKINLFVFGSFGGGAVTFEVQLPDGSDWVPASADPILEPGMFTVDSGYFIGRLTLSGATAPNLSAWAEPENADSKVSVLQTAINT